MLLQFVCVFLQNLYMLCAPIQEEMITKNNNTKNWIFARTSSCMLFRIPLNCIGLLVRCRYSVVHMCRTHFPIRNILIYYSRIWNEFSSSCSFFSLSLSSCVILRFYACELCKSSLLKWCIIGHVLMVRTYSYSSEDILNYSNFSILRFAPYVLVQNFNFNGRMSAINLSSPNWGVFFIFSAVHRLFEREGAERGNRDRNCDHLIAIEATA